MERVLGVKDLFAVGYGDLGSSIYYALGITAMYALGATPIALLIAGLLFACTALTYSEMSSIVSESGGSASYTRKTFNDLVSFIAGWALLLDYVVTIAISSYSVGPYLSYFFPILKQTDYKIAFTLVIILALFVLNLRGGNHSAKMSLVLTFLTVTTQLVIIIIGGIAVINFAEFAKHLKIGIPGDSWSPSWPEFFKGVAMAMVAYTGIESMTQLSGEAKDPNKTVPRAILWSMGTLLFMYMGISIVALNAMTPQVLSTTYIDDPIAGIVAALPFGGPIFAGWVGLLGAIILFVAANAGLLGSSRLSFNMGENIQLPRIFFKLHKKYKTPYMNLLFFALLASLLIIWSEGSISFLADLYNVGAMLAFFAAHVSLIMHRIRFPDAKRPFRIKCNIPIGKARVPITAIIGAVASISVWILILVTKPDGRYLGITWIGVGIVCYIIFRKQKKLPPAGNVAIEKIKVGDYQDVQISKVLVPTRGGIYTDTVQIACQAAKSYQTSVVAVYIVEVPFAFPLYSPLFKPKKMAEFALKRAEAIAQEYGVEIELKVYRARSVVSAILELTVENLYDLVIIGAQSTDSFHPKSKFGYITDEIFKKCPSRVWICKSKAAGFHDQEVIQKEPLPENNQLPK